MSDFVSASHDVMFKALFVKHPDLLRAFIRDILELPLTDADKVIVLNPELIPEIADGKMGRLDIHVEMVNQKFNVEMQARQKGFSADRILYYWAEMFTEGIKSGTKYEDMEPTYSVNILGFNFLNCKKYHSSYSVMENDRHERLSDKLSIHLFELPKVPNEFAEGDLKQQWMELIKADSEEALEMVRNNTTSPAIQQGVEAVFELNADTILREQIRARDKAIRDYDNDMAIAKDEGRKEERARLVRKWREKGKSEEEIRELLADI